MNQLNESQRKFVMSMGIIIIISAIVLIGVSIGRGGGLPVMAPLLIVVGLLGIIFGNKK